MQTTLTIEGMSCGACVSHVETALKSVPGVAAAQVDLAQKRAVVTGTAAAPALLEAVAEAGYEGEVC